MLEFRCAILHTYKGLKVSFTTNDPSIHTPHTMSMKCRMYHCRWETEIMNKAAKSMAPRKRANMVPIQVAIMAITPITVLTMAATTMETITVITSTDTQTAFMAATDLMEYIRNRYTWWIGFYKINVSDRIVLLLFLSKYGWSSSIVLDPR